MDQLHNQYGLSNTGAAEQPDFAASGIWGQQIDDLDASFKHLRGRRLICQRWRGLMDAVPFCLDGPFAVNGFA